MSTGLGIAAGLAGSVAINTGNNLQSLGMHQLEVSKWEEAEKNGTPKPNVDDLDSCESRTWIIGTTVFVTGSLLNFASYGLANQSLLASLEAIQFVTNVFFGKFALGKEVTPKMYLGTCITVGGTIMTVAFSSKEAATIESVNDLLHLWTNPIWISYLIFAAGLGGALHVVYGRMEAQTKDPNPVKAAKAKKDNTNIMAVIYATFSALFGTLSVVFAKLLAEFLGLLGNGVPIFEHWFFYITLICWLAFVGVWLNRLNSALSLYDPLFIIPLLQSNFIFFAIVSGGIYFQEFNYMEGYQWGGFIPGVVVIFAGIYLLKPEATDREMALEAEDEKDRMLHRDDSSRGSTDLSTLELPELGQEIGTRMTSAFMIQGTAAINQKHMKIAMLQKKQEQKIRELMLAATKRGGMTHDEKKEVQRLMKLIHDEDQQLSVQKGESSGGASNGAMVALEGDGDEEEAAANTREGRAESLQTIHDNPLARKTSPALTTVNSGSALV